jgi:hypothetical protein
MFGTPSVVIAYQLILANLHSIARLLLILHHTTYVQAIGPARVLESILLQPCFMFHISLWHHSTRRRIILRPKPFCHFMERNPLHVVMSINPFDEPFLNTGMRVT